MHMSYEDDKTNKSYTIVAIMLFLRACSDHTLQRVRSYISELLGISRASGVCRMTGKPVRDMPMVIYLPQPQYIPAPS